MATTEGPREEVAPQEEVLTTAHDQPSTRAPLVL